MLTHRPRNINAPRAAALLYGDLGTSKAYVIGLAFALVGYASFWLIAAVSLLTIVIGLNYITICKHYPNGGGVYASVRHRSPLLALFGAFFIIADYLVTASLSALSAFSYLGVSDPVLFAMIAIALIGFLNYFGPKHTGSLALLIGIATFAILTLLLLFALPYFPQAWHNITPLKGDAVTIWTQFVGVIVALSGIEAVANTTGIMKLDPRSSYRHPMVTKTAKKAILSVILEVAIYTSLFAFVISAIPSFSFSGNTVSTPDAGNVRDYMLKYAGQFFVGNLLGSQIGYWFGQIIALALALLLLSAVNTAIAALVSLQYIMANDNELPASFQKMNRLGVPHIPLILATFVPIILILSVRDIVGLAALYAVGFVGAIATNLGSTSTDQTLELTLKERGFMFFSFVIMAAVEITILIDKPAARFYALSLLFIGFLLHLATKKRGKVDQLKFHPDATAALGEEMKKVTLSHPAELYSVLVVINKQNATLQKALEASAEGQYPLHLLFIRKQLVISENDVAKRWQDDQEASALHSFAMQHCTPELFYFHYSISDSPIDTIRIYATQLQVNEILS